MIVFLIGINVKALRSESMIVHEKMAIPGKAPLFSLSLSFLFIPSTVWGSNSRVLRKGASSQNDSVEQSLIDNSHGIVTHEWENTTVFVLSTKSCGLLSNI